MQRIEPECRPVDPRSRDRQAGRCNLRGALQALLDARAGDDRVPIAEAQPGPEGTVLVGDPVTEIARYAREIGADLIVVGHRHLDSWAQRWWRGSVSKALIEHAPCNVLVAITRAAK